MNSILTAVRHAFRRLLRSPAFTLTVVATLGLGIGATTAVFTLVDAVLLRPLPYAASDRLVMVQHTAPGFGVKVGGQSDGTYLHYEKGNHSFEAMGAFLENLVTLTDRDDPEQIPVALVTPGVFSILGVKPALGRLFTEADANSDGPSGVVMSHEMWVSRYGADPAIVGRTVEVNRRKREVLGVLPPGVGFPKRQTRLWYAMPVEGSKAAVRNLYMGTVARLRPGVTPEAAQRDLDGLVRTLPEAYPDVTPQLLSEGQFRARVVPLKEAVIGDVRPALLLLLCTAGFVLLITWANVANLFLVRAERQRKDVSVERALGASRGDLARRFLSESVLCTAAGGALAIVLAMACVRWRFGLQEGQIPRLEDVRVSGAVIGAMVAVSLLSGALLGGMALLRAGRANLAGAIKGAGRTTAGPEGMRAQRFLVALQVALALALLIGSAMMVESFWRLRRVELGFQPRQVIAFDLSLPFRQYPRFQDGARFQSELLDRIRGVPGVESAAATVEVPLTPIPDYMFESFAAEGASARRSILPRAAVNLVTPGYYETMKIPLLRGRGSVRGPRRGAAPPVVISGDLARTLFRGEEAVGQRVRLAEKKQFPAYTVVGVAGAVPGENLADGPGAMVYFPVTNDLQNDTLREVATPFVSREAITLVVRTRLPASSLVPTVRGMVRDLDPKVPVPRVRPLDEVVAEASARTRLTTLLLLGAALGAVLLGMIGIYGIISYTVGQRTREFGVRLALGATPADVNRLVLGQGVRLALVGIAAGLVAAWALTRFLRGLLYEVSPGSPLSFAAMSAALLAIALAAMYLPARRAGRIDPVRTLRAE